MAQRRPVQYKAKIITQNKSADFCSQKDGKISSTVPEISQIYLKICSTVFIETLAKPGSKIKRSSEKNPLFKFCNLRRSAAFSNLEKGKQLKQNPYKSLSNKVKCN